MASYRKPTTVKLPGFIFLPGPIFSNDMEVSHRVYAALIGEDITNVSLLEATGRARRSFETLFETALQYEDLHRNLRGGDIFYEIVAHNATLYLDLPPEDVKIVFRIMVCARGRCHSRDAQTNLNNLVDRFIALEQETAGAEPPQPITVTVAPSVVANHEARQIIQDLASTLRGLNVTTPWPPSFFTTNELVIFADRDVCAILGGVTTANTNPRQPLPAVGSRTLPTTLRVYLCCLSLTKYTPTADWALFPTPVAFIDENARRDWYVVGGRQTKIFTTLQRFLFYAGEALTTRGKTVAVAMLNHWLMKRRNVDKVVDLVQNDPMQLWTEREMMRRYAWLLILRKVEIAGVVGIQFAHSQHAITAYREDMADAVQNWADANDIRIMSRYYGGPVSRQSGVGGDSVRQCLNYLETLVSAHNMDTAFPLAYDEASFDSLGYVGTK